MTNYNDGKWHGWNGGECPVHPETVVEVAAKTYPPKMIDYKKRRSGDFVWDFIIAFRIVKEYREPREFWLLEEGYVCTQRPSSSEWIHVREVIDNG